jgi:signal transduction histidine kinase
MSAPVTLGRVTDRRLPLHEAIDALHAWARSPDARHTSAVRRALEHVATANGLRGAHLTSDAPPLAPLACGVGTLARRPLDVGRHRDVVALHSTSGQLLGELVIEPDPDGPAADGRLAARAIELCLDAAWSAAEARLARERMAALDEAARAITSVLDVEAVLQLIVDRVRDLVAARYTALGIVDAEGHIDRFITSGMTAAERVRIGDLPHGHGLLGVIIREGRSILVPDIAEDPRRSGFPAHHPPMHTFLGVPVVVRGVAVGNLYLTDRLDGRPFSDADRDLVEAFARHAAVAVENARLHDRLARLAVVEDRERIGRELHDGIIQSIYAVSLGLEDAAEDAAVDPEATRARIDRAIDDLGLTIRDLRNYIFGLRPYLLLQAGLAGGLAALANEVHVNTLIDIEVDSGAADGLAPSVDATHELLSIAREALTNVSRHAQASRARVELRVAGDELAMTIIDNGRGMPASSEHGPEHQGIGNMRERAADLGGRLEIESGRQRGTRIIVTVPLTRIVPAAGAPASEEATDR